MEEWGLIGWLWTENAGTRRFFVVSKAISSDILHTATTKDFGWRNGGLCDSFNIWSSEMFFTHACWFLACLNVFSTYKKIQREGCSCWSFRVTEESTSIHVKGLMLIWLLTVERLHRSCAFWISTVLFRQAAHLCLHNHVHRTSCRWWTNAKGTRARLILLLSSKVYLVIEVPVLYWGHHGDGACCPQLRQASRKSLLAAFLRCRSLPKVKRSTTVALCSLRGGRQTIQSSWEMSL